MKKLYIDGTTFFKDGEVLVNKIQDFYASKNVNVNNILLLIPCRGGEIIGSLVKRKLDLVESQISRVKVSNLSYDSSTESSEVVLTSGGESLEELILKLNNPQVSRVLIVDDLVETGQTINFLNEIITNSVKKSLKVDTFPIYTKNGQNTDLITGYSRDLEDKWIVFPWESLDKDEV